MFWLRNKKIIFGTHSYLKSSKYQSAGYDELKPKKVDIFVIFSMKIYFCGGYRSFQ